MAQVILASGALMKQYPGLPKYIDAVIFRVSKASFYGQKTFVFLAHLLFSVINHFPDMK